MKRITINKKDVVVIICSFEDLADGGGRSMAVRSSVVAMVGFGSKDSRCCVWSVRGAAAGGSCFFSTAPSVRHCNQHPHPTHTCNDDDA